MEKEAGTAFYTLTSAISKIVLEKLFPTSKQQLTTLQTLNTSQLNKLHNGRQWYLD